MKKYFVPMLIILGFIGMAINIQWDKDSVKAFITGGVLTWMAMKFFKM